MRSFFSFLLMTQPLHFPISLPRCLGTGRAPDALGQDQQRAQQQGPVNGDPEPGDAENAEEQAGYPKARHSALEPRPSRTRASPMTMASVGQGIKPVGAL